MIIPSSNGWLKPIFLMWVVIAFACNSDQRDDDIPYLPFEDIVINLSLPEYFSLQSVGTYRYLPGGVKGIILYHHSANTFYAFERNCSFRPNDACSTVEVDASGLGISDPCCGSSFSLSGEPRNGPAWRPLRRYYTQVAASQLIITDAISEGP